MTGVAHARKRPLNFEGTATDGESSLHSTFIHAISLVRWPTAVTATQKVTALQTLPTAKTKLTHGKTKLIHGKTKLTHGKTKLTHGMFCRELILFCRELILFCRELIFFFTES